MTKPHTVSIVAPLTILAPDNASLGAMEAAVAFAGAGPTVRIRLSGDGREVAEVADEGADETEPRRVLLAIDKDLSVAALDSVRQLVMKKGWVGVWSRTDDSSAEDAKDVWLLEQLLLQYGATPHKSLAVLAAASRLHVLRPQVTTLRVLVNGKPSGVLDRLLKALVADGFKVSSAKKEALFSVGDNGEIRLGKDAAGGPIGDPLTAASALKLVCRDLFETPMEDPEVHVRQKDVDLIVQPPPRLLSEPTSKKLVLAFGMKVSDDQLCGSPTEAARVVSGRTGLSVFKLAKPRLEKKQDAGAVVLGVGGAPAARRAVQILESLGESLGPPPPLGILVCPQVDGGLRVWLKMQLHPRFGRIVLLGKGDRPDTAPLAAFKAPVSSADVLRSLMSGGLCESACADIKDKIDSVRKIALCVSLFSKMVHTLSGRINRAEIHPLVASKEYPEALILDALAAVGPDEP